MEMPLSIDSDASEIERSENSIVEDSDPDIEDSLVGEKTVIGASTIIISSGKALDIDLSNISVGDGSFHSSPSQTEDKMPSERLHEHQRGENYRRSSSVDQLGISKMREWLKERLGDYHPDPHVLTDAYIQESMTAFKDGRYLPSPASFKAVACDPAPIPPQAALLRLLR
jgi:hypothetical protein